MKSLFKAKTIEKDEWIEGNYIHHKSIDFIKPNEDVHISGNVYGHKVDESTLCQSTPFDDKNGRLLFYGDIIQQKLMDKVEPEGFHWWRAKVGMVNGCWVLLQIGFDYSNTPMEEMTFLHEVHGDVEYTGNISD